MSIVSRLRKGAIGIAAVAALAATAVPATAGAPGPYVPDVSNPNTTNIPYLAWRGENIRMVKCWGTNEFRSEVAEQISPSVSISDGDMQSLFGSIFGVSNVLEDWSGQYLSTALPQNVVNGAKLFLYPNYNGGIAICAGDTWSSQKAGLGQFKTTAYFSLPAFGSKVLIMQHQFLAAWMNLGTPTIEEVASRNPAVNPEALGDPLGDGNFIAGDGWVFSNGVWTFNDKVDYPGEVQVTVKGTIPLLNNYDELGLGDSITMPDDWAELAAVMATDADPRNFNPAMRWDIHDEIDESLRDFAALDPVDNLDGVLRFTRVGLTTASFQNTVGPFDPNFALETLLPDGVLDEGDAPMPAARVDFNIAGDGYWTGASKAEAYSRNDQGTLSPAENLFLPYYSQYIPATSRDVLGYASGIDGALVTNNFNGFLHWGEYKNWQIADNGRLLYEGVDTDCRNWKHYYRSTYNNPGGDLKLAVAYTDEHGESRLSYNPGGRWGNGFGIFDDIVSNSNNGCDLGGINPIGGATISVTARYPYQKVTDPDKPAAKTLTKTTYSLFQKVLSYYPKGPSVEDQRARIVLAHAQDIQGKPYVNEKVCISAVAENSGQVAGFVFNGTITTYPGGPLYVNTQNASEGQTVGLICARTDANGNAAFEIFHSFGQMVDVIALFVDEGLLRDVLVNFGVAGSSAHNPPLTPADVLPGGAASGGQTGNGTGVPSDSQVVSVITKASQAGFGGATVVVTPAAVQKAIAKLMGKSKIAKAKITMLRLVKPLHGKRYIHVFVKSAKKTAKVTFLLKGKNNKILVRTTRVVKTNKLVKLQFSSLTNKKITKVGYTIL